MNYVVSTTTQQPNEKSQNSIQIIIRHAFHIFNPWLDRIDKLTGKKVQHIAEMPIHKSASPIVKSNQAQSALQKYTLLSKP